MEIRERNDIPEEYKWDLSTEYSGDDAWEKELAEVDADAARTAAFEGRLKDAATIREFFDAQVLFFRKLDKLANYAMRRHDENVTSPEGQTMYGKLMAAYAKAGAAVAFAQPEILKLPVEELEKIASDPVMEEFEFKFRDIMRAKAHVLAAEQEKLLAQFAETFAAPQNIASQLRDGDMVFENAKDANGAEVPVSGASFVTIQMSPDRVLRESAFRNYYRGYREHINTYTASYTAAVKVMTTEAGLRGYESSRAMSLSVSNVPVAVYDNLIDTVRKHMDLMYRYVALRKRMLGVSELHFWDVYTPLVAESEEKYPYETGKDMVLDAVSVLGDDYVEQVKKAFSTRMIDVYPNKGKRGGAYSSGGFDTRPYILLNYTDTLDSVYTLAHEMGHSMHTWHSCTHQPAQYSDYTMFVAEVASTVNENLLTAKLLAHETDPKKRLVLLNQYLEGFKGTVYRQTMFAEFERDVHAAIERGESVNAKFLNDLYKKLVTDYFGPDMVIDEEIQYEWARIPHFYNPFYVYVYATGFSSAVALSEQIMNEGAPAVKRYREFLSMGSSAYPVDELAHAGVDLNTPAPIEAALLKFGQALDEAEKCLDLL